MIFNVNSPNDSYKVKEKLNSYLLTNAENIHFKESDHVLWAGDFNRHHSLWDKAEDVCLSTRGALMAANNLIELLGHHDMVMALPYGELTLQHMVTKRYSCIDDMFFTESMLDMITRCKVDVNHQSMHRPLFHCNDY